MFIGSARPSYWQLPMWDLGNGQEEKSRENEKHQRCDGCIVFNGVCNNRKSVGIYYSGRERCYYLVGSRADS